MPRVALTEAQRREYRYKDRSGTLADGLAVYKSRKRLSNEQMAAELGIGKNTIPRLLNGEDVKLPIMAYWRLLEIAGLRVINGGRNEAE